MSIVTFGVIFVALLPIFREKQNKIKYAKVLRAQIRLELYELIFSFKDKLDDIERHPEKGKARKFKDVDLLAIIHLEKLFENVTYLTDKEFLLFDKLMAQYRAYTFPHLRKAVGETGIQKMKKTTEQLVKMLEIYLRTQELKRENFEEKK